jgi:phospholipase/lecithinase/hemolysin
MAKTFPYIDWQRFVRRVGMALVATGISVGSISASAGQFTDMVTLGDSLSDTGNVLTLSTFLSNFDPPLIPGLQPYPLQPPYKLGRFSNGNLWVETLANRIDLPSSSIPAGLTLGPVFGNAVVPGFGGSNYAIAGAMTGTGGTYGNFIPTGLAVQTDLYLNQHSGDADPTVLYLVVGGGNDVRMASAQPNKILRDAMINGAVQDYRDVVAKLVASGARTIVVANVPDFGKSPESRVLRNNTDIASDATRVFNKFTDRALDRLAGRKNVTLARVDWFGLMNAIIEDSNHNRGRRFGVTNVDTPCLDVSVEFPDVVIPGAGTVSCDVSLFADDHHPTAKVHDIMGEVVAACETAHGGTIGGATSQESERMDLGKFCHVSH